MERRAQERKRAREERISRRQQQEEQQSAESADVHTSQQPSTQHLVVAKRSKLVAEMERRAEERHRVHEERRLWHQRREEQRLVEEKEAEQARLLEEEEEKQRQLQERREQKRAEHRRHAEKLVALARQRQRMRQAHEFWVRNRLVDVWCTMRQAVIESDEMLLAAWTCYRRSLYHRCFNAWRYQQLRGRTSREACYIAQARIAEWYFSRYIFRTVIRFLRMGVRSSDWQVATARTLLAQGRMRRSHRIWKKAADETIFARTCAALKQYAKGLIRIAFIWWMAGAQQSRLDTELEQHKQVLHEKVSLWLHEIDGSSAAL